MKIIVTDRDGNKQILEGDNNSTLMEIIRDQGLDQMVIEILREMVKIKLFQLILIFKENLREKIITMRQN